MKKLVLMAALAACGVSVANAAPTVYGKAFLTLDYVSGGDTDVTTTTDTYVNGKVSTNSTKTSTDGGDVTELNSNSSRIGLKGAENLTDNTDVVYQLEYGIDVDADDNGKKQFYSRDTYLGLANKQYGTLLAGRLSAIDDSINYVSQAVGQFDNSFGDAAWDGNRINNAFAYVSPDYNGMNFMAMYALDNKSEHNGLGHEGWGVGVKYEPEGQPYRGGITYIQAGDFKTTRISGAYDLNNTVGIGALYQLDKSKENDGKDENVFSISGTYQTASPWKVYAQADFIDNVAFNNDADSQQFVIGGKYAFSKQAIGHVYGGYRNNEYKEVVSNVKDGNGTVVKTKTETDGMAIGAGLEYLF